MKKIIIVALLISMSFFAFTQEADEYITEETSLEETEKKPKKSIFSFGNNKKVLEASEGIVFSKGITGQLKQQRADYVINLDTSEPGFGSPYLASYSYIFMNSESAAYFSNAFEQYEKDFEAKRLERKGSKLYKKYGKFDISVKWGAVKMLTPNYGTGKGLLGYEFVNKSPYFTLTIYPVKNKYHEKESTAQEESPTFKFYFTKSAARKLIEHMDAENVNQLLMQLNGTEIQDSDSESDEY